MSLLSKTKKRTLSDNKEAKEKTKGSRSKSRPTIKAKRNKNIKGMMDKITFIIRKPQEVEPENNKNENINQEGTLEKPVEIVAREAQQENGEDSSVKTDNALKVDNGNLAETATNEIITTPDCTINDDKVEISEEAKKTEENTNNPDDKNDTLNDVCSDKDRKDIVDALLNMVEERVGTGKYVANEGIDDVEEIPDNTTDIVSLDSSL